MLRRLGIIRQTVRTHCFLAREGEKLKRVGDGKSRVVAAMSEEGLLWFSLNDIHPPVLRAARSRFLQVFTTQVIGLPCRAQSAVRPAWVLPRPQFAQLSTRESLPSGPHPAA